jgi:uncharacterized membrane protein YhaH (DUF805 family)
MTQANVQSKTNLLAISSIIAGATSVTTAWWCAGTILSAITRGVNTLSAAVAGVIAWVKIAVLRMQMVRRHWWWCVSVPVIVVLIPMTSAMTIIRVVLLLLLSHACAKCDAVNAATRYGKRDEWE